MTSYRELLQQTKAEISELDARAAEELEGAIWIDVREADEWQEGHLPGAVHVPRGFLESRIEGVVPDKAAPIVLYCAAGNRSAFAAKTLAELGYENVALARRRLHRLEAKRRRDRAAAHAVARAAHAVLAPPADPRDRRGRPAEAARLASC